MYQTLINPKLACTLSFIFSTRERVGQKKEHQKIKSNQIKSNSYILHNNQTTSHIEPPSPFIPSQYLPRGVLVIYPLNCCTLNPRLFDQASLSLPSAYRVSSSLCLIPLFFESSSRNRQMPATWSGIIRKVFLRSSSMVSWDVMGENERRARLYRQTSLPNRKPPKSKVLCVSRLQNHTRWWWLCVCAANMGGRP